MNAMNTRDAHSLRQDFPILSRRVHGKPLVYLDNAASSQRPQSVIDRVNRYEREEHANVHRGMHHLAELATTGYENARKTVARFLNAKEDKCVIFTRGTTEGINLVAHAWGRKNLKAGDRIILSEMEHHSNIVPWQLCAQATGATISYVRVTDIGTLDMEHYRELLAEGDVKLVSLMHVSNALGTINPAEELVKLAHEAGARILIDAAQSAPHMRIDVHALDPDWLVFSGHKICGPTGIGVLYGRESILEDMDPFLGGGEMIDRVDLEGSTWADLPYKFEAGTPNMSGAIGLGAAIDYIEGVGFETIERITRELSDLTVIKLSALDGVRIFGSPEERGGAVSFEVEDIHPHDLAQIVDQEGVAIRAGHLCCQPLMKVLGVPAVARASVYFYNLPEEIDQLVHAIQVTRKIFGHGR